MALTERMNGLQRQVNGLDLSMVSEQRRGAANEIKLNRIQASLEMLKWLVGVSGGFGFIIYLAEKISTI